VSATGVSSSLVEGAAEEALIWSGAIEAEQFDMSIQQVLVRSYQKMSVIQMDVIDNRSTTVSFVAAHAVQNHASCEGVYAGEDHWFMICDIWKHPIGAGSPVGRNKSVGRYLISATNDSCEPLLLGQGPSEMFLQIALEVSAWPKAAQELLVSSYDAIGSNGAPRLGQLLSSQIGVTTAGQLDASDFGEPIRNQSELSSVSGAALVEELEAWLERTATALP
jgi:hypothetical protein